MEAGNNPGSAGAGGASSGDPSPASRQLKVEDALAYLEQVKQVFNVCMTVFVSIEYLIDVLA